MQLNPVLLSIPVFFILMALEVVFEAVTGRHTYRLNDALTNISTGILNQLTGVFVKVVTVGVYVWVEAQTGIFDLPANGWTFLAVFVLYDLCYYWSHRMAHEVSLFWGGHVVHHQSEEYNLSVALRQSATSFIWSLPFYLPLAIFGFDPMQFLLAGGLNLVYQFWIHTNHIGKLGPLEWVLNTPSHHRVHHGRDPKYIDKNYAGVFIIWDRLFGTFQVEEERPRYGITKPLNSWDPVYANVAHYKDLFKLAARARSPRELGMVLFGKPGAISLPLAADESLQADRIVKYNQLVNHRGWNWYTGIQFTFTTAITAFFLFTRSDWPIMHQGVMAGWIALSLILSARKLVRFNPLIMVADALRLVLLALIFRWIGDPSGMLWIVVGWIGITLICLIVLYTKSSYHGHSHNRHTRNQQELRQADCIPSGNRKPDNPPEKGGSVAS